MATGHLSDVFVVKPIFHRGRLVAFSATTSHMPDIGGRIRAIEAREVFEEGLHIPLAKLVHAGRVDDTLVALVRANVRTPDQTMGDIWAQVSANELLERRVRALLDDYGPYRPVRVEAPDGSLLNPRFPAAVVSRATTGHYVPALVLGALHRVIPDRVMAGVGSPLWALSQSSTREDGRPYTTVLFFNGGMGATPIKDGENVLSWPSNISSTPVEVAERQSPLFFHYKRLRPGSGGAGRFRGGLGQDILIESRSPRPIVLSVMAERTKFPAPGLAGGAPGGLGDVRINGTRIDNRKQHVLERGDRVLVSTPGGGGYGPRARRDKTLIARDRALGYVGRGRRAVKEERP